MHTTLKAQSAVGTDQIVIHFDKPFYATGEVMWYKVYLPSAYQGQHLALKMALWHPDGQSVTDYFLNTGGAIALDGYFKLPYDLASDMYHLLVLGTEKDSKKRIKLAEAFIPIYNDLNQEERQPTPSAPKMAIIPTANDLKVSIQLGAGPFQKREAIQAAIKITDQAGRPVAAALSISVVDAELVGEGLTAVQQIPAQAGISPAALDQAIYINGNLTDQHDQPRAATSFGVFSIAEQDYMLADTGPDGDFALPLPNFTGSKPIQFVDLRNDSMRVHLHDGIILARAPQLPYTEAVKNYLEWSRSRKMVYQLYNTVEANLQVESTSFSSRVFKPDHRVVFKEYATFPDLFTFFTEVLTTLKFRMDKDKGYYAQMFNPDPRMRAFYQGEPIFIVDGKITRDVNFLQAVDFEKMDTFDLFFDFTKLNTNFGKLGSNGVAIVKTSIPNLRLPASDEAMIFSVNGLLPEARLMPPENPDPQQPVFRSQIFWSPEVRTDQDGRVNLSFPQSDDLGTFRIEVMAQSRDGAMGYGIQTYQVQWFK